MLFFTCLETERDTNYKQLKIIMKKLKLYLVIKYTEESNDYYIIGKEKGVNKARGKVRHLARNYDTKLRDYLDFVEDNKQMKLKVAQTSPVICDYTHGIISDGYITALYIVKCEIEIDDQRRAELFINGKKEDGKSFHIEHGKEAYDLLMLAFEDIYTINNILKVYKEREASPIRYVFSIKDRSRPAMPRIPSGKLG